MCEADLKSLLDEEKDFTQHMKNNQEWAGQSKVDIDKKIKALNAKKKKWENTRGRLAGRELMLVNDARNWYCHHLAEDIDVAEVLKAMDAACSALAKVQQPSTPWKKLSVATTGTIGSLSLSPPPPQKNTPLCIIVRGHSFVRHETPLLSTEPALLLQVEKFRHSSV